MSIDPRDFIDSDEGREEPAPFFTYGEPCENCGSACDAGTRVFIPGWNFNVCDQCAEECRVLIFAEENCPALYRVITRARRVSEASRAFDWHKLNCARCNPKLKLTGLPARRSSTPEGTDGTGQRKEAA